jgi:hypothetical protein
MAASFAAKRPAKWIAGVRRRSHDRAEQIVAAASTDLAALEAIQQLLESQLCPSDDPTLKSARACDRDARCEDRRQHRNGRKDTHDEQRAGRAHADDPARDRRLCRSTTRGAEVRVEPDVYAHVVDGHDRRRRLERLRQRVVSPANLECTLEPDEKILPRLPHDAIRVVALHDQHFLILHPSVDRREHIGRLPDHGAIRAHSTRTEEAGGNSALVIRHR